MKEKIMGKINKLPLKLKIIIICIAIVFMFNIVLLMVMLMPLMAVGIIDVGEITANNMTYTGASYYSIGSCKGKWWPIGSNETEEKDGIIFASNNPTNGLEIRSSFGPRDINVEGASKNHQGIDIAGNVEIGVTNVIAADDGVVTYPSTKESATCPDTSIDSSCGGKLGNYVVIKHSDGTTTRYGHMHANTITVQAGDTVKRGQVIGKIGNSGNSGGAHLHFEVRVDDGATAVDPVSYVSAENPRNAGGNCASNISFIEGSEAKQTVCLTLKENGLNDNAIAGIMGNFEAESSFIPSVENSLHCKGLAQWCFGRAEKLVSRYGNDWKNINNQLEYMFYELENDESGAMNYLGNSTIDGFTMGQKFCYGFERPEEGVCESQERGRNASAYYPYVTNNCSGNF